LSESQENGCGIFPPPIRRRTVIPSAILGRYARSLTEIVFEKNVEQEVTGNLNTYSEIFHAVPDLLEAFHTPAVPRESKEKLLDELMAKYPVNPITSNFLRILLQHNRMFFFQQILDLYLKLVNAHKGVVSARVTTAMELSEQEMKNLVERLSAITGKSVNIDPQTDASILGGVVVQLGSTIFDGSIKSQLAEMKRRLTEA
jgi:F-type H+-transporting ATPase subunit delta